MSKRIYVMNTWRDKKVIKEKKCLYCCKLFVRNKKNTKFFNRQKYCNKKCWLNWFKGRNHHKWIKNKVRACVDCKGFIERHTKKRCRLCWGKWIQRNKSGNKSNFYKHGLYIKGNIEGKKLGKRLAQNKRRFRYEGNFTLNEWGIIIKKFKNKCAICKISGVNKKMTIDHIIPISKNGKNIISNIQPLCLSCNCRKGNRLLNES